MALALRSSVLIGLCLLIWGPTLTRPLFAQPHKEPYVLRVGGPTEERILAALEKETVLEFLDTPVADVAAVVEQMHDIPIMIDVRALEEVGLDTSTPVNISIRGVALRTALTLALDELDLGYFVDNSVLQITTKDVADDHREIRIYDVRKMFPTSHPNPQQLATLITQTLTGMNVPQVVGGGMMSGGFGGGMGGMGGMPGGISAADASGPRIFADGSLLVISATLHDQQEVAEFLSALVRMKEADDGEPEVEKAEVDAANK